MKKEVKFTPIRSNALARSRWIVHVTVTSPETGKALLVSQHECRDRHHAATLLSEIRELAEDLADFLPGLAAEGYELSEASAALPSFAEAVAESTLSAEDKAYWQSVLASGELLGKETAEPE